MTFFKTFKCSSCGTTHKPQDLPLTCKQCNGILHAQYDLDEIANNLNTDSFLRRAQTVWRYIEFLPLSPKIPIISLGEGGTHFHKCRRLAQETRFTNLYLKDETINPTGSFIDRGIAVELSALTQQKVQCVCSSSIGNLTVSLAAYAAHAGIKTRVIMNRQAGVDIGKLYQIIAYGAEVDLARGRSIGAECLKSRNADCRAVLPISPYFLEGIKTTIFEVVEQLDWRFPDWVIVPMGSGAHLSQIWKGLHEIEHVGLVYDELPRLVGVQSKSCSPIVEAFEKGKTTVSPWIGFSSLAKDIGIANPRCGTLALQAIRESNGFALAVSDGEILEAVRQLAHLEGVFVEPSSATVIAALHYLQAERIIDRNETVVCVITGMGLKYPEALREIVRENIGLQRLLRNIEGRKFSQQIGLTKRHILEILFRGESYGYEIWKHLSKDYGIRVTMPSVYQHLNELKTAGLITQTRAERTYQRRLRRYYTLSVRGRDMIAKNAAH